MRSRHTVDSKQCKIHKNSTKNMRLLLSLYMNSSKLFCQEKMVLKIFALQAIVELQQCLNTLSSKEV